MASVSDERGLPAPGSDGRKTERCPRCGSHNTKFCYYNNYSLAQPRHFCKACRRYWTIGGSLRSVPVGGSTRSSSHRHKQQPPADSLSAASSSSRRRRLLPTQAPTTATALNPASPSSSSSSSPPLITSLALDALSLAPVSVVPKTEPAAADESTATDALGCFTSLLREPLPAWSVAFGDTFHHGPEIFARDVGLGGSGTRTGPLSWLFFSEEGDGAGVMVQGNQGGSVGGFHRERDAWQVMNFGAELFGFDHGECFGSPVMAISTTPRERSAPARDGGGRGISVNNVEYQG